MHAFPKSFFVLLAITILLGACAPAQPAQSPEQIQAQVSTSVAMTVAAQDTQTAAAQPTSTATSTPTNVPFPTFPALTSVLPSPTTFVVVPPSSGGGGGGGSSSGGGSFCADAQRCCDVVDQEPEDWPDPHAILKPGDTLDVKWDIQNVGTKTWDPTWTWTYLKTVVDSSEPANATLTTSSITSTSTIGAANGGLGVPKKSFLTIGIELTAPDFQGNHEPIKILTKWAITGDGAKFCTPYIYIEVVKPGMQP